MKRIVFLLLLIFSLNYFLHGQSIDKSLLEKHVYTLASDSLMGRGFGTKGGRMAEDYIEAQFKDAGILPWEKSYKHPFLAERMMVKIEGCNIIGWIEGNDPILKNEYIVVGAHYDHLAYKIKDDGMVVYNGADDNASGVATVIELGRWLAAHKDQLKRSVILVAFDGEEAGLVGSAYMVKNKQIPTDRVKMMFSLDMVGMLSKYKGIDMVGNATLANGKNILDELAGKHNIQVKKEGKEVEMQTDTSPFGKIGIPAVHVFTSTVSPYHKPEDDADKLDYDGIKTITEFMADAVTYLSSTDNLLPDKQFLALAEGKGFRPKFGYKLGGGSSYNYYKDEFYVGKSVFAAQVGFYSKISLSKRLALQPEVLYRTQGSKHVDGTLRTHEVNIPLNIRLSIMPKNNSIIENDFYLFVGPYYSYRFAGKVEKDNMDFTTDFYRDEYGIQWGVGFEVMKVQFMVTSYRAFNSISRSSNIFSRGYIINLGFQF